MHPFVDMAAMLLKSSAPAPAKRILITHEFAPFRGGVATYVEELASAITQQGGMVEVWAPDYASNDLPEIGNFPVVRLRSGGSLRPLPLLQFVKALFKRRKEFENAEVILASVGAHLAFMILLPLGLIRCERLISLLHGSEVLRVARNPGWKILTPRLFRKVQQVLTVSEFSRSLITQSFLAGTIKAVEIAPCACTTAATMRRPAARLADGKIRILTLARIHPRKGQLDIAQALIGLPDHLREKVIYQAGGRGDEKYLRQVQQTCMMGKVAFKYFGEIEPARLPETYAQCDIYAMTSRMLANSVEGFGITYLDAGFHGKPVIGYDSGGAAEAVVNEQTGLLVAEGNIDALTTVIARLIEDSELRKRLGEGGIKRAAQFSWQATAKIFLAPA